MKKGTQEEFEELVEKAKKLILTKTGYGTKEDSSRRWVRARAKHKDWSDGSQDVELIVFEGSPAKGYIIVNYGTRNIKAFGLRDKPLYSWNLDN